MALKPIGGEITSQELNDNFSYLNDRIGQWKAHVETADGLPSSGNEKGDARYVLTEQTIYAWDGTKWEALKQDAENIEYGDSNVESTLTNLLDLTISEMGSNGNGFFVRWANGFQICWGEPFSQAPTTPTGNAYRSEPEEWIYPAPFDGAFPIFVIASCPSSARWADPSGTGSGESVSIRQFSLVESEEPVKTRVFAVGRWE